jgi:hypothetical protein
MRTNLDIYVFISWHYLKLSKPRHFQFSFINSKIEQFVQTNEQLNTTFVFRIVLLRAAYNQS